MEYNKKMIKKTRNMSENIRDKSSDTVNKLTHPTKKVNKVGSAMGTSVGLGLVVFGGLSGSVIGIGSLIAGIITIASNILYNKKHPK